MIGVLVAILLNVPTDLSKLTVPIPTPQEVWIFHLEDCESSASSTVKIIDSNGKVSAGILQFQENTWLSYGKKFGTTKENILDVSLQEVVAESILDAHETWHWKNCYAKVSKKYGVYPFPDGS